MKREALLRSVEYWVSDIQNELFGVIENYMNKKKINRSELAIELKVNKSYVTQILNGDFDHKVSKLVELSLSCGKVPILSFVDTDEYIKNDTENKYYQLMPMAIPHSVSIAIGSGYNEKFNYLDIAKSVIPPPKWGEYIQFDMIKTYKM